jgi:hypothetical protein
MSKINLNKTISLKELEEFNNKEKTDNVEIRSIMLIDNDSFILDYEGLLIESMHIHYDNNSINYYKMVVIDWLCGTFGVDSITDSETDTKYYCLQTGDIYDTTICFNGNDWFFTSFGDLVEMYDNNDNDF